MTVIEMQEKRTSLIKEARTVLEAAKTESRDLSAEERAKYDGIVVEADQLGNMLKEEERVANMEKTIATVPMKKEEKREKNMDFAEIRSAMVEKRAITVNGTGATEVISNIVQVLNRKRAMTAKYRYFYGPNASTVVPLWSPTIATPAGQSEAATGVAADSTAVLSAATIQPKAYVSLLPVSAEALLMSGAALEAQLPGIFAEAFGQALFVGSLTGDGTGNNMSGMFVDANGTDISCAAAGAPKLTDLLNLALKLQDYTDEGAIVINPTFLASMLLETTAESAPIKMELLASRTCMGVPVIATGAAPTTITASSLVAVGMSLSNYGVAIANEMTIDPIKVKGDTNTYFQATMFFNGKVILPVNSWQLKTI